VWFPGGTKRFPPGIRVLLGFGKLATVDRVIARPIPTLMSEIPIVTKVMRGL